jgi:hypothetical protein
VVQAAVEPHRRVERADLVHEHERELGFERVAVLEGGEVAALLLARDPRGAREPVDDLAHAGLMTGHAGHAGLAEVLAHHDVGGELRPRCGHFDVVHGEDRRTIRVRNHGLALVPLNIGEWVTTWCRVTASDVQSGLRGRCGAGRGVLRGNRLGHEGPPWSVKHSRS